MDNISSKLANKWAPLHIEYPRKKKPGYTWEQKRGGSSSDYMLLIGNKQGEIPKHTYFTLNQLSWNVVFYFL